MDRFSQTLILGCNSFDQTKEKLTLNPKEWGFPATIDEKYFEFAYCCPVLYFLLV